MFKYPIRFYNWNATTKQLSFLNFLQLYDYSKIAEKNISVKITFEDKELCKVLLRKDNKKVDFTNGYNFFELEKKLLLAVKMIEE